MHVPTGSIACIYVYYLNTLALILLLKSIAHKQKYNLLYISEFSLKCLLSFAV